MQELDSYLSSGRSGTHGLNEELGRHRGREGKSECVLCGAECESVVYVLWECSASGAETPCQKWGGSVFMKFTIYINSEMLHSSFDPLTTKFWGGLSPPLSKSGGAQAPPAPPILCL